VSDLSFLTDDRGRRAWHAVEQTPELAFLREPLTYLLRLADEVVVLARAQSISDYARRQWEAPSLFPADIQALALNFLSSGILTEGQHSRLAAWYEESRSRRKAYESFNHLEHWKSVEPDFKQGVSLPLPLELEEVTLLLVGSVAKRLVIKGKLDRAAALWRSLEFHEVLAWNLNLWNRPTQALRVKSSGEAETWWLDCGISPAILVAHAREWNDQVDKRSKIKTELLSAAGAVWGDLRQSGELGIPSRSYYLITVAAAFCVVTFQLRPVPGNAFSLLAYFEELLEDCTLHMLGFLESRRIINPKH